MTGPAVLFSDIPGFDAGRRILVNPISSLDRVALTVGFPTGLSKADYCDLWLEKTRTITPIPPREVAHGPVMENVIRDGDVDLSSFPAPIWHRGDGGRYIGTGCVVITRDPDDNWINLGTYRVMVATSCLNRASRCRSRYRWAMIRRSSWAARPPCPMASRNMTMWAA